MPEWSVRDGIHTLRFNKAFLTARVGWSEKDGAYVGRIDGARTYQTTDPCENAVAARAATVALLKDLVIEMAVELRDME